MQYSLEFALEEKGFIIIKAVGVWFIASVILQLRELDKSVSKITKIEEQIAKDDLILIAKTGLDDEQFDTSVIVYHRPRGLPLNINRPSILQPLGESKQWAHSYSMLWGTRLQNYMFSSEYLQHFKQLQERTLGSARRILIVDTDRPRSQAVVELYMHMSMFCGYATYIYTVKEFYKVMAAVEENIYEVAKRTPLKSIWRHKINGQHIQKIKNNIRFGLLANSEMCAMFDDESKLVKKISRSDVNDYDYMFRYYEREGNRVVSIGNPDRHSDEIGVASSKFSLFEVRCIYSIMRCAISPLCKDMHGYKRVYNKTASGIGWHERVKRKSELWTSYVDIFDAEQ